MICQVDSTGWCERHKERHEGRPLELSQMDNELGESYRQLWDRMLGNPTPGLPPAAPGTPLPGRLQQAVNFAKAVSRHVVTGMVKASAEEKDRRLAICRAATCGKYRPQDDRCAACGCPLELKAPWQSEECPLGLWDAPPPSAQE